MNRHSSFPERSMSTLADMRTFIYAPQPRVAFRATSAKGFDSLNYPFTGTHGAKVSRQFRMAQTSNSATLRMSWECRIRMQFLSHQVRSSATKGRAYVVHSPSAI